MSLFKLSNVLKPLKANLFKTGFLVLTQLVLLNNVYALKGKNIISEAKDLPPQMCKVDFGLGGLCSGFIISEDTVITASHCNVKKEKRGKVSCLNGQSFNFKSDQVTFYNPDKIPSGLPMVDTKEDLKGDLLLVKIKEKFNTNAIPVFNLNFSLPEDVVGLLRQKDQCYLYGVGITSYGTIGLAHGIVAPPYKGLDLFDLIELVGVEGVAPHDSGGGYVCEYSDKNGNKTKFLMGVIVGRNDTGNLVESVILSLGSVEKTVWLKENIK